MKSILLVLVGILTVMVSYGITRGLCRTRRPVNAYLDPNLVANVSDLSKVTNLNASGLSTNRPALPAGWKILRSDDGLYKWTDPSGFHRSGLVYSTEEEARASLYNHLVQPPRVWTVIEEGTSGKE